MEINYKRHISKLDVFLRVSVKCRGQSPSGESRERIINQYAGQKTLTDVLGASMLVLELSCFRKIVVPYHLRMLLCVFMGR